MRVWATHDSPSHWFSLLRQKESTAEAALPPSTATGARPAAWICGHWTIENLLHHGRTGIEREIAVDGIRINVPPVLSSLARSTPLRYFEKHCRKDRGMTAVRGRSRNP